MWAVRNLVINTGDNKEMASKGRMVFTLPRSAVMTFHSQSRGDKALVSSAQQGSPHGVLTLLEVLGLAGIQQVHLR